MLRKIRKDEIRQTAETMAECFNDYPLYDVFFGGLKNRKTCVFYFFWYRLYTRMNYTYVSDDLSMVFSVHRPGDKDVSSIGLILNPVFMTGFFLNVPLKALSLVTDFGKMADEGQKKYYDPQKDTYVQAICVLKKSRAGGNFFKEIRLLDDGSPAYCETHTEKNVRLYEMMGFKLCDTKTWYGIKHYIMRRDARPPRTENNKEEANA